MRPTLASCFSKIVLTALLVFGPQATRAEPFQTIAPVALLVDVNSGMVLLDKASSRKIEPAAMVKLMTVAVVADAVTAGELTLDTEYPVSEDAWRRGGAPSGSATMFAALRSRIKVSDLLRGAMVQAANDACLILAEGIAGNEAAFVERMQKLASKLDLRNSHFVNVTGFADPAQTMTARDIAKVARFLIERHPDVYAIYAEKEFTWNKIRQLNRNPMLAVDGGADGLATGASPSGGFGLVASVTRDGRRLILVMQGLETAKARADEAKKLIDWGFSGFTGKEIFADGEAIGDARVFGGAAWSVPLVADGALRLPVRTDGADKLEARILYDGPVAAPIAAGTPIGRLHIVREGAPALDVPLKAKQDVAVGGMAKRAAGALYEMTIGLVRAPVETP